MLDIFKELEIINNLIEENTYKLQSLNKFYNETVIASFEHQVDYQNIDTCLDHMNYGDYSKMISRNLKRIINEIAAESQNYYQTIKALQVVKAYLTNQIISLSQIRIADFIGILEKFNYHALIDPEQSIIELLEIQGDELVLSALLTSLPSEIIDFLFFYINEKNKDPHTYIEETFQNFELQKEEKRNL